MSEIFKILYNIGQITLRENEFFWIFDIEYFNGNYQAYQIHSPWFSYMGEKWCLVKLPYDRPIFRMWMKVRSNLSKYYYTIQLRLNMSCSDREQRFIECSADADSDYGCELKFRYFDYQYKYSYSKNGLLKLFFNIQKKEHINIATECNLTEERKEDTKNTESTDNSEDEEENCDEEGNSDDEANIDDGGNPEKKCAIPEGINRLVHDLRSLLLNGQISDVTLKVEDREFKVHRIIMIARSPVFASMLQHDTKENATGVVDIPDCSTKGFEAFLSYIYTGSASTISSENVFDLYYAADKYQVNDLKLECVDYMKKNLTTENFCAIMSLSLQHSETDLQKKSTKFFCRNVKVIIKTVQWQKYVKDYPVQANELFIKAVKA